ncbi:MAG TPA: hypothetical protein VHL53_16045 [Acidimicrobiia bacterium]|nr:hypothetical protein [Acidimicrobiia bacterium]
MGGIELAAVMDAIAANLAAVTGLRCYEWPTDSAAPPAGIVGYPERITYDMTYGRGADRATFPVWILLGAASSRTARDDLSQYLSASSALEIKQALDGRLPVDGQPTVHTCVVTEAVPDAYPVNGVLYLAAKLTLDVVV